MKTKSQQSVTNQEGQGLLEAIVALTVAVLVIVGLIRVVISSINTNDFSKKKITSTHLAQQAMERVRAYRDANAWDPTFSASCSNSPKTAMSLGLAPEYTGIYELTVTCTDPGPVPSNKRKVVVTVFWTDSTGTKHSSIQESTFTKINAWQ